MYVSEIVRMSQAKTVTYFLLEKRCFVTGLKVMTVFVKYKDRFILQIQDIHIDKRQKDAINKDIGKIDKKAKEAKTE